MYVSLFTVMVKYQWFYLSLPSWWSTTTKGNSVIYGVCNVQYAPYLQLCQNLLVNTSLINATFVSDLLDMYANSSAYKERRFYQNEDTILKRCETNLLSIETNKMTIGFQMFTWFMPPNKLQVFWPYKRIFDTFDQTFRETQVKSLMRHQFMLLKFHIWRESGWAVIRSRDIRVPSMKKQTVLKLILPRCYKSINMFIV